MRMHPITTTLFVGLVLVMAWFSARAVARVESPLRAAGVLLLYLVVPGVLACAGLLDRYDPMPAPPILLLLALVIVTSALAFSGFGMRIGLSFWMAALLYMQPFLIIVDHILSLASHIHLKCDRKKRRFFYQ